MNTKTKPTPLSNEQKRRIAGGVRWGASGGRAAVGKPLQPQARDLLLKRTLGTCRARNCNPFDL